MTTFTTGLLIGLIGSSAIFLVIGALIQRRLGNWRRRARRTLGRIRSHHARLAARAAGAERLAEVATLTGGLAHEIKNPLSTVLLNLQLLQEDLDPRDPAHARVINRLNTVAREAARLRDILDDFLKYAGKIELRRQDVNLNQMLEELVDFFAPQARVNRVQIRLRPSPTPVIAAVDARLIKQAVLNLMINATQAMSGGGELILSAGVNSAANPEAIIDVIDTGPGIPAEEAEKIFQAYYSTKKGGTGLGLAMSRRIVEEHGGQIGVRSEPGKGSDFFIRLPLRSAQ